MGFDSVRGQNSPSPIDLAAQPVMLCDRSLSFFHSFCHSVNRITDERGNGRLCHWGISSRKCHIWNRRPGFAYSLCNFYGATMTLGHFPTFVSISLFSQFSYNQQPIWTKLGEMNALKVIPVLNVIAKSTEERWIQVMHINFAIFEYSPTLVFLRNS